MSCRYQVQAPGRTAPVQTLLATGYGATNYHHRTLWYQRTTRRPLPRGLALILMQTFKLADETTPSTASLRAKPRLSLAEVSRFRDQGYLIYGHDVLAP